MITIGNLGGALSPIMIGISRDRWGSWHAPLFSVAVLYVAAGLCWLLVDPALRIEPDEAPVAGLVARSR